MGKSNRFSAEGMEMGIYDSVSDRLLGFLER